MAAQLIDNIIDEQAIKKQLDNLDAQLTKTAGTLGKCAEQAKIFSDQFANCKGINDIIALTEKYNQVITISQKAQNDMISQDKQRAEMLTNLQKIQESSANIEKNVAQAVTATQKAQESAAQAEQKRVDSSTKSAAASAKAAAAEQELSTATQTMINILTKEGVSVEKMNMTKSQAASINKLVTTANGAEKGSHEQLAAQYDLNYKAYNKLSAVQRDTTAGKAMQGSLLEQSNTLKSGEGALGNFTRDVGNYKNAILGSLGANQGFIGNLANIAMGAEKTGDTLIQSGVGGLKAFGSAATELLSNPIVAIVAAIAVAVMLVKAAIDSNGEATEKLGQVLAPFKELLAFVLNIFSELVTVVLDLALGFLSVLNSIMALIPGLDAIAAKNQQAIALEQQKQAIEERGRQQTVKNAKDKLQFDDMMMKSRQKDVYSIQQRLEFLQKADAIELSNSQEKTKLATDNYNLLLAQMENEGKTYEQLSINKRKALTDAEAAMYDTEAEYAEKTRRLHTQESTLVLEDQAEYIANLKTKQDADLEAWKASQNVANMTNSQKIAFEAEYSKKSLDNQKKANDQKIADIITNNKTALALTIKGKADELTVEFDAETAKIKRNVAKYGAEYEETKEQYDARKELLAKNIADMAAMEGKKDASKPEDEKLTAAKQENDILAAQQKEADQKATEARSEQRLITLKKQQDANLLRLKADSDYNNLTFDQQMAFDAKYFAQQQINQKKIIDLTKETNQEKAIERNKLASEAEIFAQDQAQKLIEHAEKMLQENASYQESDLKANENYGDKSIGYQQLLATRIFNIRADMETKIAKMKFDKDGDSIAYQTTIDNIEAQRLQLSESQKLASETDLKNKVIAIENDTINQRKIANDLAYSNGEISATKYEKNLDKINKDGAVSQLENEIWLEKEKLATLKVGSDEYLSLERVINSQQATLANKQAQTKLQAEKELAKAEIDLLKATASSLTTIADDQFQGQLDKISALKTANETAATEQNSTIQAKLKSGLLSQKEADSQSAAIDAQKTARDTQLDQQAKETQRKQAVFDKEMAVFTIGLDTTLAVMSALAPPPIGLGPVAGIPLGIVTAAIGAVQLAAALAKPLPAYAFGTEDHIGGSAIVGDGFRNELAITPTGDIIKTPAIPTIMNLPVHTKVFPDFDKALQEMAFNASISSMNSNIPNIEINAYNDAAMRKTMGSLVSYTQQQIDELGRLKNLDRHLGNIAQTNKEVTTILKSMKKNPWVN